MKIKNFLFSSAFVMSILAAFAFKAPSSKLASNAALPSACSTLVADCASGTHACLYQGQALQFSNGIACTGAATKP